VGLKYWRLPAAVEPAEDEAVAVGLPVYSHGLRVDAHELGDVSG
jgi:hypothetical protein